MSSVYWVDIIEGIVDDVRNSASLPSGLPAGAPYYMHGHPLEIINTLSQKDRSDNLKYKKYPAILLFQDFEEVYGENAMVKSEVQGMNLAFVTNTDPNLRAEQRYDATFRPILQPLYELFLSRLIASKQFLEIDTGLIPHTKIDRLFWGVQGLYGTEGNIFNDHIDAIEISDLNLKLAKIKYC